MMDNIKEKLVELLLSAEELASNNGFFNSHHSEPKAELVADHLIANGVTVQRWISVEERLPESGVHVLVACEVRGQYLQGRYVCDGYYVKAKTHPSYGNPDECAVEYNEEDDEYYLLEGWYEVIKNWDDYDSIVIDDFVTHWMPLPEPPKGE